jgi:hypothetical protein
MDDPGLDEIARQLSDLEVALLLCLVAREHCLIETTSHCIHDLAKELALVGSEFLQCNRLWLSGFRLPQLLSIIHIALSTAPRQHLLTMLPMMFSLLMREHITVHRVPG